MKFSIPNSKSSQAMLIVAVVATIAIVAMVIVAQPSVAIKLIEVVLR